MEVGLGVPIHNPRWDLDVSDGKVHVMECPPHRNSMRKTLRYFNRIVLVRDYRQAAWSQSQFTSDVGSVKETIGGPERELSVVLAELVLVLKSSQKCFAVVVPVDNLDEVTIRVACEIIAFEKVAGFNSEWFLALHIPYRIARFLVVRVDLQNLLEISTRVIPLM